MLNDLSFGVVICAVCKFFVNIKKHGMTVIRFLEIMNGDRSAIKGTIIRDFMASPTPMPMDQIIRKYTKPTKQAIYRHIRDLISEKVILFVWRKGAKSPLALNTGDFKGVCNAFKHLLKSSEALRDVFDKAFIECAISAFGEFPLPLTPKSTDISARVHAALLKNERLEIDDEMVTDVSGLLEEQRGHITDGDKLLYMHLVKMHSEKYWEPDKMLLSTLSVGTLFGTLKHKPGYLSKLLSQYIAGIWKNVILTMCEMEEGKRKTFLGDVVSGLNEAKLIQVRLLLILINTTLPLSDILQIKKTAWYSQMCLKWDEQFKPQLSLKRVE